MKKKIVYIAHPIGGDVKGNLKRLHFIYRQVVMKYPDVIPFIPYYATVMSLGEDNEMQRAIGFSHNEAIFNSGIIDEVWLYGKRISEGMRVEIGWAKELGIKVVSKSEGKKV